MVTGHHRPFSLSLLFGSTNLFTLRPRQRAYSRIVPHQTRFFPSLLLFLHFSRILILIERDHVDSFTDTRTHDTFIPGFSLLTKTLCFISISDYDAFLAIASCFSFSHSPRLPWQDDQEGHTLEESISPSTTSIRHFGLQVSVNPRGVSNKRSKVFLRLVNEIWASLEERSTRNPNFQSLDKIQPFLSCFWGTLSAYTSRLFRPSARKWSGKKRTSRSSSTIQTMDYGLWNIITMQYRYLKNLLIDNKIS